MWVVGIAAVAAQMYGPNTTSTVSSKSCAQMFIIISGRSNTRRTQIYRMFLLDQHILPIIPNGYILLYVRFSLRSLEINKFGVNRRVNNHVYSYARK